MGVQRASYTHCWPRGAPKRARGRSGGTETSGTFKEREWWGVRGSRSDLAACAALTLWRRDGGASQRAAEWRGEGT